MIIAYRLAAITGLIGALITYNVAAAEIYQNGFRATELNDIMSKTGLTKGAFYHHFKSNDQSKGKIRPGVDCEQSAYFILSYRVLLVWPSPITTPRHFGHHGKD